MADDLIHSTTEMSTRVKDSAADIFIVFIFYSCFILPEFLHLLS